MIIHLRRLLPTAFARGRATYPDASRGQRSNSVRRRLVRRRAALLGLAPGGVCRATPVTWGAGGLLHRRFTLTTVAGGGLFSVALSRGSPRVGVTHHPALWSPDFPQLSPRSPGRLVRDHGSDRTQSAQGDVRHERRWRTTVKSRWFLADVLPGRISDGCRRRLNTDGSAGDKCTLATIHGRSR